jgi:hypothetical protein
MAKFRAEQIRGRARFDLPASLAREIGRFLVTWAHFEHYVQATVWNALSLGEEAGRIAVREPRITDRLDMLRDLCELKQLPIDYVLIADIRKRADPLAAKRHILAHSLWFHDRGEWGALITRGTWAATQEDIENPPTGSKTVSPEWRPITTGELAEWTRQTIALIADLKKLDRQHRPVPQPSPRKPRARSAQKNPTQGQDD